MAKISYSEQAIADLEDVFAYTIATFGEAQAQKYRDALEGGFKRIADDPRLGRPIAGRTPTFSYYVCERHTIFYTNREGGIFIVRVLHVAMDFMRHFPE